MQTPHTAKPHGSFGPPKNKPTIVLLRGMLGFSKLLWWEYFHGAPRMLEDMGFKVIVPATPWGEGIVKRSACLNDSLRDCAGPLHLIGHSMGGLDARHFITHHAGHEKVASLTTISTPHHGSFIAEHAMRPPYSPWRHIPAVADLSYAAMQDFNRDTPDMPGIVYRSYSAARPLTEQPWMARPFGRSLSAQEGANDSLVSVASAQWGEHIATLKADHFELIGSNIWLNPLRKRVPFPHLDLYRDIGQWSLGYRRKSDS